MHEIFQKRHAVRSFEDKKVEPQKISEVLAAAGSAPSAGNLKAREIVVVEDIDLRKKIAQAAHGQDFIAEAPLVLVFFAALQRSEKKYRQRGRDLYAIQDATLAAGFAWLQAVALDLSACWVGGFEDGEVRTSLNINKDWRPICIMPVGYARKQLLNKSA